ncbi:hypothetical protein FB567DRAFT_455901 [Paraphoma chrysanthemicola]|uniref:Uncharacterized protein n=1 Tax=Paraphoma chrysanthemicola TaxID=798071 RepID=A0A8K0VS95_9PLEO|nr:hypothetical protein FB567DRAFT_455901 [Paraphoma chrysanthemicola]
MGEVEDEVDWSDGPLGPASPEYLEPQTYAHAESGDLPQQCVEDEDGYHQVPAGTPLPFTFHIGESGSAVPSQAQRAQRGIHLTRRQPSKEDYTNFALYQTNQKAYEAAFLKNFVAHALQPDRVAECFANSAQTCTSFVAYLKSVVHNVNGITDKIIWNAHNRIVNLLASDGKDGAPLLDVHDFDQRIFDDFRPDNLVLVTSRLNESWHCAMPEPAMVRMSTRQYPTGMNVSLFEELDEIARRFPYENMNSKNLPTSHTVRVPTRKKSAGQARMTAHILDQSKASSRNWHTFPSLTTPYRLSTPPAALPPHCMSITRPVSGDEMMDESDNEPRRQECHGRAPQDHNDPYSCRTALTGGSTCSIQDTTELEDTFEQFGAGTVKFGYSKTPSESSKDNDMAKVLSWRARLLNDHKRRLTERWGFPLQTLRQALPGIKQAVSAALSKGYRPIDREYHLKIRIIEAREAHRQISDIEKHFASQTASIKPDVCVQRDDSACRSQDKQLSETKQTKGKTSKHQIDMPRKKQKILKPNSSMKSTRKQPKDLPKQPKTPLTKSSKASNTIKSLVPHPSGSTTLEMHQQLPPQAYFVPQTTDEKPAWRCGIQHAMGYYYNAGNRTACPGCFTNIKDSKKTKWMDFYLPTSTHFFQAAPDIIYKPSKPLEKERSSKTLSHNSIAKDAYWAAIDAGAAPDEARQAGIDAVEAALRPPPPREFTPEPTPEPEPDLGPHISGSKTMEYGQDIPEGAYFKKREEGEKFAWRCDVNHALGRYYLAGDRRTCPGCSSNRNGSGKQADMDFYLPLGLVVRQEAPGLSRWKPRKPNKKRKANPGECAQPEKNKQYSHNQRCSKKYFEAINAGLEGEVALKAAIAGLEAELEAQGDDNTSDHATDTDVQFYRESESPRDSALRGNSAQKDNHCRIPCLEFSSPLVPKKRNIADLDDSAYDDSASEKSESPQGSEAANTGAEAIEIYSSEEESSGSDSE